MRKIPFLLGLGLLLLAPGLRAATWTGAFGSSWSDPGNWAENAVPTSSFSTRIDVPLDQSGSDSILQDTGAAFSLGTLQFSGSSSLVLLGGALEFPVGGSISLSGGASVRIASNLATQGELSLLGDLDGPLWLSGNVSGPGRLVLGRDGTPSLLRLSGANTHSGGSTVRPEALVVVGHDSAFGTGAVQLDAGSRLTAAGARTLANAFTFAGTEFATLAFGGDALTLTGAVATGSADTQLILDAPEVTLAGPLSGSGALTVDGGSGTLVFANSGTFSGSVTVPYGGIAVAASQALASAHVVLGSLNALAPALEFRTPSVTLGSLAGGVNVALPTSELRLLALANTTYSAAFSGQGGLTLDGPGVFTLNGTNLHRGPTRVLQGTLHTASAGALSPDSALVVTGSGRLDVATEAVRAAGLAGRANANATGWLGGGQIRGARTAGAQLEVSVGAGATQVFPGVLRDDLGPLALRKTGSGTLALANVPATGGLEIAEGTIRLDASFATDARCQVGSPVTLTASGATLQLAAGSGLPGQYVTLADPPDTSDFASLSALQAFFAARTPSLYANAASGGAMSFGSTGSAFPPPYVDAAGRFAARWVSRFQAATTGTYTFTLLSDDGSMLWIDGQLVVNNNFVQAYTSRSGSVTLTAGEHDIVLAYYQSGGPGGFAVGVQPPGGSTVFLPGSLLSWRSDAVVAGLSGVAGTQVLLNGGTLTVRGTGIIATVPAFAGVIADGSAPGRLQVEQGPLLLAGANTFTGGVRLAGGTLGIGHDLALGTGPLVCVEGTNSGLFADGGDRTLSQPLTLASGTSLDLRIGGDADARLLLAGSISGAGTLSVSAGRPQLSGAVSPGLLRIFAATVELTSACSPTRTEIFGTVVLGPSASLGGLISLPAGGTLTGSGLVTGNLDSQGTVEARGTTLRLRGPLRNRGVLRAVAGGVLDAASAPAFTNEGVIDLISGTFLPPAGFVNAGVILDSSAVHVRNVSRTGSTVTLVVPGYTGHRYQLQRSSALGSGAFSDVGPAQSGVTGTDLTFTDPDATSGAGFYRVRVD
ncbi:MAG: autotransporter-associated beta strand repeat-containing protein [Verrucomicrobia bacterium]|nr:autotransporter-associated beta strand repeat-containing protein [Verrucomicrobiota bacterium]